MINPSFETFERLNDEILVLKSIFGEDTIHYSHDNKLNQNLVYYNDKDYYFNLAFRVKYEYPFDESSLAVDWESKSNSYRLSNEVKRSINEGLQRLINQNAGNEILYILIEHLRDEFFRLNKSAIKIIENKFENSDEIGNNDDLNILEYSSPLIQQSHDSHNSDIIIHHSEVLTDRKSTFQSHLTFVKNMCEVQSFRNLIISDKKVIYS